jgi:hypothetical protein
MQIAFFLVADGAHSLPREPSTAESVLGVLAQAPRFGSLFEHFSVEAVRSREAFIRARSKDQGRKDHKRWQQRQGEVPSESGNH